MSDHPGPPQGLHPALPPAPPTTPIGSSPGQFDAHHSPHAASAGPTDGARGAMWFAAAMAGLVAVCLLGILVILVI